MELWDRLEVKMNKDTTLTVSDVGDKIEVEIEDNQYTHDLTWMYLNPEQVDQVINFLQEWKNERNV